MPAPASDAILDQVRRRPRLTSWAISTLAIAIYLIVAPSRPYVFDAGYYLGGASMFENWYSFTDFNDELRGYAFPWTLRVLSDVLSPVTDDPDVVVRIVSLVLVPLLVCVLVPTLARHVSRATTLTIPRILVLTFLFVLAWHNDLLQPLTDIPALTLMALGALLVLRDRSLLAAAGAGFAFGLALNYRPAYLLAVVAGTATLFLVEREPRRLILRTLVLLAFIFVVVIPQVMINVEHFDRVSPTPAGSTSLTRYQLTEGLNLYRYDTYVGDPTKHPASMRYTNDELAAAVREEVGDPRVVFPTFDSVSDYLAFVATHPLDASLAYVRHLLSGLDVRFGGSYVESVDDSNLVSPIINHVTLVVSVAFLALRTARRRSVVWRSPTTWFVVVLAASCLPGIVGAVEPRFLLPLHLTLLANLALCAKRADLPQSLKGRTALAGAVVVGLVVTLAASADTLSSLDPDPMGIDGRVARADDGG